MGQRRDRALCNKACIIETDYRSPVFDRTFGKLTCLSSLQLNTDVRKIDTTSRRQTSNAYLLHLLPLYIYLSSTICLFLSLHSMREKKLRRMAIVNSSIRTHTRDNKCFSLLWNVTMELIWCAKRTMSWESVNR